MASDSSELPSDMILEILSRSSLETLQECKAVCKLWKQMIYDAKLLPLNCISGYFFQNPSPNSAFVGPSAATISWNHDGVRILASSDHGILLCCFDSRYYACKPAINQWQALPNPNLRYQTASVAIAVTKYTPLRYVIVRLSHDGENLVKNCEIFDSETWAWEKIQDPNLKWFAPIFESVLFFGHSVHWIFESVLSIGHSVYWLLSTETTLLTSTMLLALDINTRSFRRCPLPESVCVKCTTNRLLNYEGRLGFTSLDVFSKTMELWVAGSEPGEWTRKIVVDMTVVGNTWGLFLTQVDLCSDSILFMATDEGAAFYNLEECSLMRRVELPYNLRYATQIFRFRSDMEIVNLKGGQ